MTRLRYDHILAGTALALILAAIPAGSLAQNADKTAPLPAAASPAEQQATEAPSANPTLAQPAVAVDPIASLDPADRAGCGKDPRLLRRNLGSNFYQQEGARRSRGVLSEPQLRSALAR